MRHETFPSSCSMTTAPGRHRHIHDEKFELGQRYKTFEYTITVIHEYLSLINDLEKFSGGLGKSAKQLFFRYCFSWIGLIKNENAWWKCV